jgi:ketosteroid isomerase-like protein
MAGQAAREIMDGYIAALGDRSDLGRFFAPDVRWTTMESGDEVVGREQVRDFIVAFHTQLFDAHPHLVNLLVGNDTAMLEARFIGTHTGEFGGVPATGASVDVPYCIAYQISDGMISALRAYMPIGAMRAQLAEAAAGRTAVPTPR